MITNDPWIQSGNVREPISSHGLIVIEEIPVKRLSDEYGGDLDQRLLLASVASAIAATVGAFFLP